MKRKVCFAALVMAVILPATAQDTYESARLLGSDLNGTARYVGMGGAMGYGWCDGCPWCRYLHHLYEPCRNRLVPSFPCQHQSWLRLSAGCGEV